MLQSGRGDTAVGGLLLSLLGLTNDVHVFKHVLPSDSSVLDVRSMTDVCRYCRPEL